MQHTHLHYLQRIIVTVFSLLKTSFQHWIIPSLPVAWQDLSSPTGDQLVPPATGAPSLTLHHPASPNTG